MVAIGKIIFSLGVSAAMAMAMAPEAAYAANVDAGDYVALPPETNLALLYLQYATRSTYSVDGGPTYKDRTGLDSEIGIARFVHYMEVGGLTVAPQILIPFGTLNNGEINGSRLDDASGIGDPILAVTVWLINDAKAQRWFGVMPYVWVPAGSYQPGRALNIGENRWKVVSQIGFVQGLNDKLFADLYFDPTWYGDNTQAGTGTQTLSQKNSYHFQTWLRYVLTTQSYVAFGYSKTWGGCQELDGVYTGVKTDVDSIKLSYGHFVTPTLQLLGTVGTDVHVVGGFKEDFRFNFRLLKAF